MDVTKLRSDQIADKVSEGRVRGTAGSHKAGKATGATESTLGSSVGASKDSPDQVKLSTDALAVLEGVQAAKSAPDVRADRVAALKASINDGSYKIDNKAIAEKMIRSSLEDDILARHE